MVLKSLRGKTVIITGASSGIGRASALAFAKRGANLVLAARRVELLEQLKTEIEATGAKALVVPTDVTDPQQLQRLFDATVEHFGGVDVLVNNAGYGSKGAFVETPMPEIRSLLDVNLLAAADAMQKALVVMERQGWGVIINISSEAGIFPTPYMPVYNASKAALTMLSESVNAEYLGTRINTVAFCPGVTESEFSQSQKRVGRFTKSATPLKPVPVEIVAEKIVQAALKPKPVITVSCYTLPMLPVKWLIPKLYYRVIRRYRDSVVKVNTEGNGTTDEHR